MFRLAIAVRPLFKIIADIFAYAESSEDLIATLQGELAEACQTIQDLTGADSDLQTKMSELESQATTLKQSKVSFYAQIADYAIANYLELPQQLQPPSIPNPISEIDFAISVLAPSATPAAES